MICLPIRRHKRFSDLSNTPCASMIRRMMKREAPSGGLISFLVSSSKRRHHCTYDSLLTHSTTYHVRTYQPNVQQGSIQQSTVVFSWKYVLQHLTRGDKKNSVLRIIVACRLAWTTSMSVKQRGRMPPPCLSHSPCWSSCRRPSPRHCDQSRPSRPPCGRGAAPVGRWGASAPGWPRCAAAPAAHGAGVAQSGAPTGRVWIKQRKLKQFIKWPCFENSKKSVSRPSIYSTQPNDPSINSMKKEMTKIANSRHLRIHFDAECRLLCIKKSYIRMRVKRLHTQACIRSQNVFS